MTTAMFMAILFGVASIVNMFLLVTNKSDDLYSKLNPLISMWACIIIMNLYTQNMNQDTFKAEVREHIETMEARLP